MARERVKVTPTMRVRVCASRALLLHSQGRYFRNTRAGPGPSPPYPCTLRSVERGNRGACADAFNTRRAVAGRVVWRIYVLLHRHAAVGAGHGMFRGTGSAYIHYEDEGGEVIGDGFAARALPRVCFFFIVTLLAPCTNAHARTIVVHTVKGRRKWPSTVVYNNVPLVTSPPLPPC